MMVMKKIAVFASGGGTDFQSVVDANEAEQFCEIAYLVASKPNIGAIDRAKKHGIKTLVYDKDSGETMDEFYARLTALFAAEGIDYILLAGWLKIIPEGFIASFEDRIVNVHPALLPAFGGKGYYGLRVHEAVLSYGAKVSGATVHFVSAEVDGGAIIAQSPVPVEDGDTPESLQQRVLAEEHKLLPAVMRLLCEGKVQKTGRQVRITQ
jgi:phosphoribosylglycinamide formyltransferase-1